MNLNFTIVGFYGEILENFPDGTERKTVTVFNSDDCKLMGESSQSINSLLSDVVDEYHIEGGFEWVFDMDYDYEKTGIVQFVAGSTMIKDSSGVFYPVSGDSLKDLDKLWKAGKEKEYTQNIVVAVSIRPCTDDLDELFDHEDVEVL